MKRCGLTWLILLVLPCLALGADKSQITFYLQAISGTDDDRPPVAEARLADPVLARHLQMFKWKKYWEIKRRTIQLAAGGVIRQRMAVDREVEIARTGEGQIILSIYMKGKLTRRRTQTLDTPFYIAGGDKDATQSWFIVVRRDKPPELQANVK